MRRRKWVLSLHIDGGTGKDEKGKWKIENDRTIPQPCSAHTIPSTASQPMVVSAAAPSVVVCVVVSAPSHSRLRIPAVSLQFGSSWCIQKYLNNSPEKLRKSVLMKE